MSALRIIAQKFIKLPFECKFGLLIYGCNVLNIKQSPLYNPTYPIISHVKLTLISVMKGYIYGLFYPLPIISMSYNLLFEDKINGPVIFMRHLIPGSKYFHQ